MSETKLIEHAPEKVESNDFGNASFDDLTSDFSDPKGGTKIDEELEAYRNASSSEKETIDKKVEVEDFEDDDLDSLGDDSGEEGSEESETEEQTQEEGEIEDFFESAEFIIWILELAIVYGTNFYLKSQELDVIGEEEFKRTQAGQKRFVKTLSKVLMKHNAKISPEVELLFQIGANYVMQIRNIIKRQRDRKEEQIKKNPKRPNVVKTKTTKKERKEFVQAEEVSEEVSNQNLKVVAKEVGKIIENQETNKEPKEETRKEFRDRIRAENKAKNDAEKFQLNGNIEEVD